jgi:molecular chaperone DnaK
MVYDLGGGTFDVSILNARKDKGGFSLQTLVVDGDTYLGGDDIDHKVMEWLVRQIEEQKKGRILADNRVARERLRQAAEKAKRELSKKVVTKVILQQLEVDEAPLADIEIELTREQLEACAADVLCRTQDICNRAVQQIARLSWQEIDAIVLVGGQTLMPAIQRDIRNFSGQVPLALPRPQEAVALGAGEYAHTLSLGGERFAERALANVVALPVGLYLPFDKPDFQPLIEANKTLPTRTPEPELVKTIKDGQNYAEITILQGKQYDASNRSQCTEIGTVRRDGILPGPAGSRVFGIVIDITEDGSIDVTVSDPTGKMAQLHERITDKPVTYYRDPDENQPKQEPQP